MNSVHTQPPTVFRPMTRNLLLLCTVLLAACGEAPTVSVFTAAPGTIAKGSSATLVFAAEGADKLTLQPGPGDVTGQAQVEVTPAETTTYTLSASNGSGVTAKTVTVTVGPTPAAGFKLAAAGAITAGTPADITVTAVDAAGATVPSYTGTVHLVSNDGTAELPADFTFTAADNGVKTVPVTFHTAGARVLVASGTVGGGMHGSFSTTSEPFTVKAGAAHVMHLTGLPSEVESGAEVSFQVSFQDAFGNVTTDYATQLAIQHSDTSAPAAPAVEASNGAATVRLSLFKAGVHTVTVQDTHNDNVKATAELRVRPSQAVSYAPSALPATALVREPLSLTITALDAKGNRAHAYSGKASISTSDAASEQPAEVTFSQGVAVVSLAFRTQGDQTVTVKEVGGALTATTNSVKVKSNELAARITLSGTGPTTAGAAASFTVTVTDVFGNALTGYQGTVHFSSTDSRAALPSTYTFTEADAGTRTFFASLQTSGMQTITVVDAARAELKDSGSFAVSAAAATACEISGVPTTATAGTTLPVRVTARDTFGNISAPYTGTMTVTATDAHPQVSIPAAAAYVPASDQGSRIFGTRLVSAGGQTITATDSTGGWSCTASVTINPAAPRIAVTLPPDANSSYPVDAQVSVKDAYNNPISYAGSLTFSSTDAAATLPANLTLTGSESGTSTVTTTFKTLGAQQLTATLVGDASVSGSGTTAVHGFVYTDPTPGMGKVRVVLNTAASSASVVQLDLVSNTSVIATASSATFARGGIYSAGMNLPLDTTRAMADSTLLVEGNALTLGAAPKAVAATLPDTGPTSGVLYTGVSQKFDGAGKAQGDVSLLPGRIFYSVRLKLSGSATVGTVFNGTSLDQRFRAAVRNRAGDEVFSNPDFALGKLEVR
ncbi:hypothetical protein ACN28E_32615 [Archangium lansingense]|uniref:hypothetical protein n=1 Tax=Archangium lansingense TaxID=2995310 RepID=UPI003B7C8FC9